MNVPLTYTPAYFGLFAALTLAVTCNSFLDIQYGTFGIEVLGWSIAFSLTLFVGKLQSGETAAFGVNIQRAVLILGIAVTIFVFLPQWGLPRAGVYFLAMLQAANNCVTTTRKHLHMGILVSAVIVSFAVTHMRADWTLLFYLVPYVCAVVFTLVSEQINQRALAARQAAIGTIVSKGQGVAVLAASAVILLLTGLLYWATPQISWKYLHWRFGQGVSLFDETGVDSGGTGAEDSGQSAGEREQRRTLAPGEGRDANKDSYQGKPQPALPGRIAGINQGAVVSGSSIEGHAAQGHAVGAASLSQTERLTGAEMRSAANRPGMPAWQAGLIRALADLRDTMDEAGESLSKAFSGALSATSDGFKKVCEGMGLRGAPAPTSKDLLSWLLLIILLILLSRSKAPLWARTRLDYLQLGLLTPTSKSSPAPQAYYAAMERLMRLHSMPRLAQMNTREYQLEIATRRAAIQDEVRDITAMFEEQRYGSKNGAAVDRQSLRQAYKEMFRKVTSPNSRL